MVVLGAQVSPDSRTGEQRDGSEEGHEMANREQNKHGRSSGAPGGDRGDTGGN